MNSLARHRQTGATMLVPERVALAILVLILLLVVPRIAAAADLAAARQLLAQGAYAESIAAAQAEERETPDDPNWRLLHAQALQATGQYSAASEVLAKGLERFPLDLSLRLALYHALRQTGAGDEARDQLVQLERLIRLRERAYRAPADRIAIGKIALLVGGDPKRVLELFYDPVRNDHPEFRESYLASGELALEKSDFALAAKTFTAATKKFPEDAAAWFGLARAYAQSDTEPALEALKTVLKFNPHHAGAWLLLADQHINAEDFPEAEKALAAALKINPTQPETHAYRAVLAHLRADETTEKAARAEALRAWPTNPQVPHLMGRKLSQKYRFAEGAALQREALQWDAEFLAAKAQLAQDLLRLGHDEEGWTLAEEVQKADPYDVVAFNLTTLRGVMANFRTLKSEHFTVRMDPREADVYGDKVLALLERAHETLTKKYGLQLRERTIVEIFPDQKDFAIRTFGLPGGDGYLGVCFGRVITANSPASRPGSPANWKAVLWHEFAHVVTLTLTKNKMPRWLSEGISVFEERQARGMPGNASGSWGEQMKPRYRAMILGEDLTPVGQLSASFLKPKSAAHLGFAYYESSLVVEWLTERWGLEKMKRLLADLARGVEINAALATHFAPLAQLEAEFAERARALAKNTGPKLDWSKPKPGNFLNERAITDFITGSPDNFTALLTRANKLLEEKKWSEAKAPLSKLIELYPNQHDSDSAYALLARAHRELGETDAELAVLSKLADLAADATEAFARLMQLCAARQEWPKVLDYAARFQAVDPLRAVAHRYEAEANEALGKRPQAIGAYRTLLQLDPPDPPELRFRLARLLHAAGDPSAKREVLMALETAPRFRAAHELLLEITGKPATKAGAP